MIGEVEKDPWGLASKIVTKRLVTRRNVTSQAKGESSLDFGCKGGG